MPSFAQSLRPCRFVGGIYWEVLDHKEWMGNKLGNKWICLHFKELNWGLLHRRGDSYNRIKDNELFNWALRNLRWRTQLFQMPYRPICWLLTLYWSTDLQTMFDSQLFLVLRLLRILQLLHWRLCHQWHHWKLWAFYDWWLQSYCFWILFTMS